MRTKHWSLDARTNMRLAAVWLAVCAGITLLFPSRRLLVALAIGAIGGVAFGTLQNRAIRASPRAFREAESAPAVRRAAVAVRPGAIAIRLQWLLGLALFILGLSGPPEGFITVPLAGYFAMMLVRELVSYRSLVWLESYEPPPTTL
jgi:hypothetical protein